MKELRILFILTGGTFSAAADSTTGERVADVEGASGRIRTWFAQSVYAAELERSVSFTVKMPMNTLSENMTIEKWKLLLRELYSYDPNTYDGVLLAHGTDTLAYTAAMLSQACRNLHVPVFLVASQQPLGDPQANGYVNFLLSTELIRQRPAPGVYVLYQNANGRIFLHRGETLEQCTSAQGDLYSCDAEEWNLYGRFCAVGRRSDRAEKGEQKQIIDGKCGCALGSVKALSLRCADGEDRGEASVETEKLWQKCISAAAPAWVEKLQENVLFLRPYVGIRYDLINLEGICAVVHGLYHSETACAEPAGENSSLLSLLVRCREKQIPVFLVPCRKESFLYGSTGTLVRAGAIPVAGITPETAYARALIAGAKGLTGKAFTDFVQSGKDSGGAM